MVDHPFLVGAFLLALLAYPLWEFYRSRGRMPRYRLVAFWISSTALTVLIIAFAVINIRGR